MRVPRCRYFSTTPILGRVGAVNGHNPHLIYNDLGEYLAIDVDYLNSLSKMKKNF
jgi:hypothetical protein